jgi:Tfp pilus assembly protein PilZ
LFKKIIISNSQVPAAFTETFATTRDNQRSVRVTVRQGGSATAKDNEFLGEFVMSGLTAAPRMETKVDVTFKIDSNGMLHASAMEQGTGERKRITIRNYAEFVQHEGTVAPDLEGDVGGEAVADGPSLQPTEAAQGRGGGAAKPQGFLSRFFGRKANVLDPSPEPGADAATATASSDAIPDMPAFLRDIHLGQMEEVGVVHQEGSGPSLDAVGVGLESLGMDDFAPLSLSDLDGAAPQSPVASPTPPDSSSVTQGEAVAEGQAVTQGQSATEGRGSFGADADEGVFVMSDGDDDYYDDEDLEDDVDLYGSDGFMPADEPPSDDLGSYDGLLEDAGEPESPVGLGLNETEILFEDDPEEDLLLTEDETEEVHHVAELAQPAMSDVAPLEMQAGATEANVDSGSTMPLPAEQSLTHEVADDVAEFEVDDSTRSIVHGLTASTSESLPTPNPDYWEEDLWSDEDLPDDGTVEFIADGATATPRGLDWEDSDAEVSLPEDETLVDKRSDWSDEPTDPPLPVEGGARRVLRVDYRSADRLAKELGESLRRGSSFVATDQPLAVGAECMLEYHAPGLGEPLALAGVVTWSTADGISQAGQPPRMDVEYRIDGVQRQSIESHLADLGV